MATIWKFPLLLGRRVIEMPRHARVLTVQVQHGTPYLWVLVNPDAATAPRIFRVFGTGHPVEFPEDDGDYVGTFQLQGGALVFHVFEQLVASESSSPEISGVGEGEPR